MKNENKITEQKMRNNDLILKGPWRVCPDCGKALFPTAGDKGKVYKHVFDPIGTKKDGTEVYKYNCFYKEDENENVLDSNELRRKNAEMSM